MKDNPAPPFYKWQQNCHMDLHSDWYRSDERKWAITFDQYSLLRFRKYVLMFHPTEFPVLFDPSGLTL